MKCLEVLNNEKPLWILGHERATVVNFTISLDCRTSETSVYANAFITRGAQPGVSARICTDMNDLTGRIGIRVVEADTADDLWTESSYEPKPTPPHPKPLVFCSFCGKTHHDVAKIIAGPDVFICNECVMLCHEIVSEYEQRNT